MILSFVMISGDSFTEMGGKQNVNVDNLLFDLGFNKILPEASCGFMINLESGSL